MTVLLNTENLTEKWKNYLEVNQKAKPVGFCAPDKKKMVAYFPVVYVS